jgi:anti-sigma factor RsiW
MCDERERLIGYLYEECDAEERRQVETHLESCPTCRAEIGGLQSVRTDLLAWNVPEHSPIWRPMPAAVAPPVVWWRQTPGWALAAAAAVVLAAGLAGGAATRLMTPAPAQPQVAGVTADELNAVQQQIVSMLRAELDRVRAASAAETTGSPLAAQTLAAAENPNQVERRITAKLEESDRATLDHLVGLNNMLQRYKGDSDREVLRMRREIEELRAEILKGGGR